MMIVTVEQLMKEDHKINNLDDICKVQSNSSVTNLIAEVQWVISKLKDEQNR